MNDDLKAALLSGFMQGAKFENSSPNIILGDGNTISIGKSPTQENSSDLPTPQQMVMAVENTMNKGFWWGNTGWSVVYRIYQMAGYRGNMSQFIGEVNKWPFANIPSYTCNYDSVCKPLSNGKMQRELDCWPADGVPDQFYKLGLELKKELEKKPSED